MMALSLALVCLQAAAPREVTPDDASGPGVTVRLERAAELLRQGLADEALALCADRPVPRFEPWRGSAARLTAGLWVPATRSFPAGERDAARLAYGRGVCLRSGAQPASAESVVAEAASPIALATDAFEVARALAGPGSLRRDAIGNLAWLAFVQGDLWRARIPELGGAAVPEPPAAPGPDEVDALDAARGAYLVARGHLVELLRLLPGEDRAAANARALVELTLRRLRELESVERQREQSQEEESDPSDEGEEQDGDQRSDDQPADQDAEQSEEESGEEGDRPDEQEPENPDDPDADRDGEGGEDEPSGEEEQDAVAQEEVLTREEVMRLLRALQEIEAEGEKLQERLRRMRRVPGDKDW